MANGAGSNQNTARPTRTQKINAGNQQAARILMQELQTLQKEQNEGFTIKLLQEDDIFEWEAGIFGPPDTLYAGGYFKAIMKFPALYPFSPPTVNFKTKIFHPNVYNNGSVCISILHPQTDSQRSGELPSERWNPAQNAYSVLMSIISLLNEPNTNSPANVEASIMYRRWKEKGDKEYERIIKEQVEASKAEAAKEGIQIPDTLADYCVKQPEQLPPPPHQLSTLPEFEDMNEDDTLDKSFSEDDALEMEHGSLPADATMTDAS
ncbi:ubiquitin-conjugating enzyme E2 R2-like [Paramacrobiotus metropolitanus]|uniref:ubiquitin-conjugating enzyme E2 R2-like n=1 Tax=Paramacrobiotus metropolitanus TaxID=2943436 RepID=UPI002446380A|nr:ubiquitin-conjugating enzyme E2 R2-like [Paramacrobiotus metropolitanus]